MDDSFTPEMTAYAFGTTDQYPSMHGVGRKAEQKMRTFRRQFILSQLQADPTAARELPDFHLLMDEEIRQYCKRMQKEFFANWDTLVRDTPTLRELFRREHNQLCRAYEDAIEQNRPFTKHRYLSITAKRRVWKELPDNPSLLAEVELALYGVTTYGIP